MMKSIRFLLAVLLLLPVGLLAGETWYPGPWWKDEPDRIASSRARKGGVIRFNGAQAPKSFNYYVDNNSYAKMMFDLMYDCLIGTDAQTLEFMPSLARRWSISDDGNVFTFVLDERAKWSDGLPVTAEDVKWTFDQIMEPMSDSGPWKVMLGVFESPEIVDRLTVRFRKKGGSPRDWRDLLNCGQFYILPKHVFEGKDFNKLDFLNVPVGGAYQITRVVEQVETEYTRHGRWWKQDLPAYRHICNFDRILMRYYVDNENAFEALKKRKIDVYPVYSARIMRGETHGEKFDRNWIVKRRVHNHQPLGFQGFAMNMRRWPFSDRRVRLAMAKLVDRETMNRTLMFGEYFLLNSYYQDLYETAKRCPNPMHLYDFAGAEKLLREAGFVRHPKTGRLEQNGRAFAFRFLSRNASEDKFLSLFDSSLRKLGIEMEIVRTDFAGWMREMDEFNFDMTWASWGASIFRAPEVSWLSTEADRTTSNNTVGFKSKKVDEIIAREKTMMNAADRADAYRAIDALIAAEIPYVLLWQIDETRLLYWNKFGMPENILSKFGDESSVFTYWWYDEDRARELETAMKNHACLPEVPLQVDFDREMAGKRK